jgi:L-lactate dehydrogenase
VVLVDRDLKRTRAEAADITHAVPFASPLRVIAGGYEDLVGARVVIITAGVRQQPGETRLELLSRNAEVFRSVIPQVLDNAPDAVLLVTSNPVDIMTHLATRFAADYGVPRSRVIGSGTTLDTARFRSLLGQRLDIDPQHIHGYVVGEHGDSEVLTWSLVTVGAVPLDDFCGEQDICLDDDVRAEIDDRVRNAAYEIIEGKGATYYGIGSALARIVEVIMHNQRSVLTVCTPVDDVEGVPDVTLALPNLVGGDGVISRLPMLLSEEEHKLLRASAEVIRAAITELDAVE